MMKLIKMFWITIKIERFELKVQLANVLNEIKSFVLQFWWFCEVRKIGDLVFYDVKNVCGC